MASAAPSSLNLRGLTPELLLERNHARAGDALVRAITARAKGHLDRGAADAYLAARPDDQVTPLLVHRASQVVGTTTVSGWASQLAQSATLLFLTGLAPQSAAAALFALSLNIPFDLGQAETKVAGMVTTAAGGFVGEADPIPVSRLNLSTATVTRKKVASIIALSRETVRGSRAEPEIKRVLSEAVALSLDSALFGSAAVSADNPAGLFNGVSAISSGGFDSDPMVDDLTSLAAAVAPIAGSRIAFVTSPARAVQIGLRAPDFKFSVLGTSAIADTRLAAVAIDALATAVEPTPDIDVTLEGILHMEDSAPAEIVTDAGTVADPVRELYQTDCVAIRLILEMDWALRTSGAVAIRDGLAW